MKRIVILSIFSVLSFILHAQTFKVEVPSKVSQDEYFHLRFIVSSDDASDFRPPSLSEFTVLAGPSVSTSSSFQMINGKTSSSTTKTYTYVLSPRSAGTFQIGAATISVNGKRLQTSTKTIQVVAGNQSSSSKSSSKPSASPDDEIQSAGTRITSRDLYITATPSRTKIYEQEGILLTYNVHVRQGIALSNVMLSAKPDFTGLIAHEIPIKAIDITPEKVGGATYRTGTILKELIFPSQSGAVNIPPVTFTCTVAQRQHNFSDPLDMFFNSGGTVGVEVQRTASPLNLQVLPLPQPRPQNFTGAVGTFQASVSLPSSQGYAGEPLQVVVKVTGTGNLQMLTPPVLPLPDSLRVSTPTQQEDIKTLADGQHGSITYTYTILPPTPGQYTIPSLRYTYFNPATEKYEESQTGIVTFNVGAPRPGANKTQESATTSDESDFNIPWLYIIIALLLLLPLVCIIAAIKYYRKHPRRKSAYTSLRRTIREANATPSAHQLSELEKNLHAYLSEKLSLPGGQLSREAISEKLQQQQYPAEQSRTLLDVLDRLAAASYAAAYATVPDTRLMDDLLKAVEQLHSWKTP